MEDMGIFQSLNYLTQKFYCFKLHLLVRAYDKGQYFSIIMLQLKALIMLLLCIYDEDYEELSQVDSNMMILKTSNYIDAWTDMNYSPSIQGVVFVVHFIIMAYLALSYIQYLYLGYFTYLKPAIYKQSSRILVEVSEDDFLTLGFEHSELLIPKIMSIIISLYHYIFFVPVIYFGIHQIQYPLAVINILLSLFIESIIIDCDYNYQINTLDYMGKPYNSYNFLLFFTEIITILLEVKSQNADLYFVSIYFFIHSWFSAYFCTYYKTSTKFWSLFVNLYCGIISLGLKLTILKKDSNNVASLMVILLLPIIYRLVNLYFEIQESKQLGLLQNLFSESNDIPMSDIDRIIRKNIFEEVDSSKENDKKQIDIYNMFATKMIQLQKDEASQNKALVNSQFEMDMLMKQFDNRLDQNSNIQISLKQIIRKASFKKGEEDQKVIYLIYLLEIMDCKKSYWIEYSELRKKKLSIKQEQILIGVHMKFLRIKHILQKTQNSNNPFDTSFQGVLHFEARITNAFQLIDQAIKLKVELLAIMKNKQIIASQLILHVSQLRNIQKQLRNELNELAEININNSDLLTLQYCYFETLAFSEKDIKIGYNSSALYNNNRQSQIEESKQNVSRAFQQAKNNKKKFNYKVNNFGGYDDNRYVDKSNLFDDNQCVVFLTIQDSVNLVFKKISNNFLDIFDLSPSESIGKRLDIIMPTNIPIALKHKQYLANFLKNKDIETSQMQGKILFGQNSKGYIVALTVDIRLNYSHSLKEIGFCAQIRQLRDESEYILFHSASLNFLGSTHNITKQVFNKQQLNKKVEIGQYFPFLYKQSTKLQLATTSRGDTEWEESQTIYGNSLINKDKTKNNRFNEEESVEQDGANKFKNNFEFMLILEQKKEISQFLQNKMKFTAEKDFSYYLLEVRICKAEYKLLEHLSYLKISKVKILSAAQNGPLIMYHLKENKDVYTMVFSKPNLDRMYLDVENRYRRASSHFDQNSHIKQFPSSNQAICSPFQNRQSNQFDTNTIATNNNNFQDDKMAFSELNLYKDQNQINTQINQENIGLAKPKKKTIDEIVEEDHSLSSVSANASSDSSRSCDQTQQIQLQYNDDTQLPHAVQNPIQNNYLPPLYGGINVNQNNNNNDYNIKSSEGILSDNQRQQIIMSDNNRGQFLLSENNREQFILNDHQGQQIHNDEDLKLFSDKETIRQKQESVFGNNNNLPLLSPIMSPINSGMSTQDMIRHRQSTNLNNESNFDLLNRKESSIIYGQNSLIYGQNSQNYGQNSMIACNALDNSCSTAIAQQRFFQDKDALTLGNFQTMAKQSGQKQQFNKNNTNEVKARRNEQQIDQQYEGSSAKSRESSSSSKRVLINLIQAKTQMFAIKVINSIGLIAFVTLCIVTLQQYISIMQSMLVSQDNLTAQDWPVEVINSINRGTNVVNFISIERQNNFTFASNQVQTNFDNLLVNRLLNSKDEFVALLDIMLTKKEGFMLFDSVSNYRTSFYIGLYYNPINMTGTSSIRDNYYVENRNTSLLYSTVLINQFIYRRSINPGAKLQEYLVLVNQQNLVDGMQQIQNQFRNYQSQQDQGIQDQLSYLIAIILLISAGCLFTILPLYSFIQGKRDLIIHMFCTFPTNQLQAMIIKIRSTYYQNRSISQHIKHIPFEIQILNNNNTNADQSHLKKQTLSSITKLPRFNSALLIIIIIAYSLLSIYPIINKIFIQNYIDQLNNNIVLLQKLNSAKEYVIESSAMTIFGLVMKIYPTVKTVKLNQYIDRIRQSVSKTQQVLTDLQDITNLQNDKNRYNQPDFDNFFFPVFENDLCKIIGNYPQYILNATQFQPQQCSQIQNGFFQKGLKLSMKQFSGIVQDFMQILDLQTQSQLNASQTGLFETFDLIDYSQFIDYLDVSISILKQFLLTNCNQYHASLVDVQLAIIIYQILLMMIIFGFGWYWFSTDLTRQITITKQYLQVININYLLDNNYILTFIKNNHQI